MTNFIKYNSIENHYNQKFIDKTSREVSGDMQWISQQKIHGANFQIVLDNDGNISFGKRSGMIDITDSFFGYREVMAQEYLQKAIQNVKEDFKGKTVRVYGELAGDGVQHNTPYGKKDFYLFDVMVEDTLLNPLEAIEFAMLNGFKIAPIIKVGGLQELLDINPEFESIAPYLSQDYNTDDNTSKITFTEVGKGTAEGYVIKPLVNHTLKCGSRVIIKVKSASHTEKKSVKKVTVRKEIAGKDQEVIQTLTSYVTRARVLNVLSHGEIEVADKNTPKIAGMVFKDILTEQSRENDNGVNIMTEVFDPQFVRKTVMAEIFREVVSTLKSSK